MNDTPQDEEKVLMQKRIDDKQAYIEKLQREKKLSETPQEVHWINTLSDAESEELNHLSTTNPKKYASEISKREIEYMERQEIKVASDMKIEQRNGAVREFMESKEYYLNQGIDIGKIPVDTYNDIIEGKTSIADVVSTMKKPKELSSIPTDMNLVGGSSTQTNKKIDDIKGYEVLF